jgi:hypothetical protein
MKSNSNNNDDDDDDDNNNNNNNNSAMGSVHARGDTFLTFGLKALTETNTSRLLVPCLETRSHLPSSSSYLATHVHREETMNISILEPSGIPTF